VREVKKRFGPYTLIQFEDFGNAHAGVLLDLYKDKACCFNDDIQGTAAVVVAGNHSIFSCETWKRKLMGWWQGVIASSRLTKKKLSEHVYLFQGAGEAGLGVASLIAEAISREGTP